ncbi:MAG: DNA mismatch repair protein MutS [SAR202 cluster bacterium]|jgi:DNA mismatch repair protein MutS|nr:DNA mismatch repair protein MutS [SAR202 cluster bacterium]MDP6301258.1 DNA mismatch repair protein MutS [SAR202 cluster bacterium]MDP7102725.1 DNA mismatch repair protein MutS [SAR202 cluster bacterium]MDP7224508.1 DNA mismatch repair protein MutS [SAR202 cluster bacterium]MDP7413008.1 DNA mismatch repair protein MutS [SAR202 cluster bacterium]
MTTPGRRQYLRIKKQHEDAILLFRMGDFYETFDEDAHKLSRELEIALTSREMGQGKRIPLAGIPHHALDSALARLMKKGHKVAICEQVSDPAASKGIVDREVVRVVTPGTVVEDALLEVKANNYLVSMVVDGDSAGIAYVDITTSEFATSQFDLEHLQVELARLDPAELLVADDFDLSVDESTSTVTRVESEVFDAEWTKETLLEHFAVASLEAYGCDNLPLAIRASGAIIEYVRRTQKGALGLITSLHTYSTASYMVLDPQTRRNLELYEGGRWASRNASLYTVLDRTETAMGGRLLRKWIGQPLLILAELEERQEAVAWFHRSSLRRERVLALLEPVADLERLLNRVRSVSASPRDLVSMASSLANAPFLKELLNEDEDAQQVAVLTAGIRDHAETICLIEDAIELDPPLAVGDGKTIRTGFSPDLDEIRESTSSAQQYIARLQQRERDRTGIKSLKVGYNRVFGYYIEVSHSNVGSVPDDYVRRQTLVGGERYITPEMKEYESQILSAQERVSELERSVFRTVCQQVADQAVAILSTAQMLARTDVFCSLAEVASRQGYVRPVLNEGDAIDLKQGRHPVVERMLDPGGFVPNDARLSNSDAQLALITGPNMAGKSTYIRQVAVAVLMAQIGSFVPAESATIGLVDRIFSRVGLQDDLAVGQSTFMVEMVETAAILNHATHRSLIILDEIGRGTSTYDGLAIAKAVAEYIHNHPRLGCKTLFATHYHELTQLSEVLPRVKNFNVAVSEDGGNIVFLRRIVPGGADKSYGVHVAQLAGLPGSVVNRAWEVLRDLEAEMEIEPTTKRRRNSHPPPNQLPLLTMNSSAVDKLLGLDVTSMTPLEAITKLYELQEEARENG